MPKYDAATLNALTHKIKMYIRACEISKETCIWQENWDEYLEEYQKGMISAADIILEIVDEMRHTAVNETSK